MKKKLLMGAMLLAMSLAISACGSGSGSAGNQNASAKTESAAQGDAADKSGGDAAGAEKADAQKDAKAAQAEGLKEAIAEQPVLLTSVGQSADFEMVKTMLDKNSIEYKKEGLATSADIGGAKTLLLAVGGSSKGLGAAGIDANGELDRVAELIAAADEQGLTIIALHIGGEARRGDLSDKFIAPSFEKADYAIVVADGDKDGLMAGLAAEAGIPIDVVQGMADVVPKLAAAFK